MNIDSEGRSLRRTGIERRIWKGEVEGKKGEQPDRLADARRRVESQKAVAAAENEKRIEALERQFYSEGEWQDEEARHQQDLQDSRQKRLDEERSRPMHKLKRAVYRVLYGVDIDQEL